MSGLADVEFRTAYRKGQHNIAHDFYLPAMGLSVEYDRAVGYFRSAAFVIAWPALRAFVERGGRIRILCSQVLSASDVKALDAGFAAQVDDGLAAQLRNEVQSMLEDEVLAEPTRVLAALVATGVLEFKVAVLRTRPGTAATRIFHDKLGILRDAAGSVLVFKGSMNETWSGLSADGNLESVDVACGWLGGRDAERVADEVAYFAQLWSNTYPDLDVRPFPETARSALVDAADKDWEATLERLVSEHEEVTPGGSLADAKGRTLKPHQSAGLAAWRANNRNGILAFATGAGKTFTALDAIHESLVVYGEVPLVVVPDKTLFGQWYAELVAVAEPLGAKILRAGDGHDEWRNVLRDWTTPDANRRLVLATMQTARTDNFRSQLARGGRLLLVADEVHRLGSPSNRALLDETLFGARLGLSATPERAGDPVGTEAILTFFGGVLNPRYTLADAVRDCVLTHYFYRPHVVSLTEEEIVEWRRISRKIAQLRARLGDDAAGDAQLERLYFQRADIVKKASAKTALAAEVIGESYERGQRWIVYCDDQEQLDGVVASLGAAGHTAMPFHSAMEGDRAETLRWLDRRGGIVVAIKCLDEGVDIPSVTHALILASSKNPREFVQRRGRVLRTAPGKALAFVHDAIVVAPRPHPDSDLDDHEPDPVTAGELARAIEFAQSADNPAAASDLIGIAIDAGLSWQDFTEAGVEDLVDD
ncbi:MAG: DEAD/DEAH box helicase family protein [Ilumatobacteraceae bacterium]